MQEAIAAMETPAPDLGITLASGWQWGGPLGLGPCSDPVRDLQQLTIMCLPTVALPDASPGLARAGWTGPVHFFRLSAETMGDLLGHPSIVRWLVAAEVLQPAPMLGGVDLPGLLIPGLGRFQVAPVAKNDIVLGLNEAGHEVGVIRGVWQ